MKKALITGASTGIGALFATTLQNQGWEVFGVARQEEKLKEIFKVGHYFMADLTTEEGLSEVEQYLKVKKFDLLINNAGFGDYKKFLDSDLDIQMKMMHLNMDALVRLSYAYLKTAVAGDALMNISSALSLMPMPGGAVYSGTKAFVTAFTECLWYELKDQDIYVFADLPGAVSTPFHKNAGGDEAAFDPKMMLKPDQVVKEALQALNKRKNPTVVNGSQYKLFTKMSQALSRKKRLDIMAKNSLAYKK